MERVWSSLLDIAIFCVVVCLALLVYTMVAMIYFGEGGNVGPGVLAAIVGTLVYHADLIPRMISIGGLVHLAIFGGAIVLFFSWSRASDWKGHFLSSYPQVVRIWTALSLFLLAANIALAPRVFDWTHMDVVSSLTASFFAATEFVTALGLFLWVVAYFMPHHPKVAS